jgi:hypothetical protein
MLVEKERTCKHFLSCGNLLHGGLVGAARPRCWTPLLGLMLVHHGCWSTWCIVLLGLAAVIGEVTDFPTIVAWVTSMCDLLWWPDCHLLLLWCWRVAVVLLLLILQAVALELWRMTRLSRGWCVERAQPSFHQYQHGGPCTVSGC